MTKEFKALLARITSDRIYFHVYNKDSGFSKVQSLPMRRKCTISALELVQSREWAFIGVSDVGIVESVEPQVKAQKP